MSYPQCKACDIRNLKLIGHCMTLELTSVECQPTASDCLNEVCALICCQQHLNSLKTAGVVFFSPRIQVFHCLHHDGVGGKTLLVDGFNAAEKLRQSNPSYFDTLVRTTIPHEYIEGSRYHLYSLGTVLSTDLMTGALTQIRCVL